MPDSKRPLIAVTGPVGRGKLAWHFTCMGLRLVGARPYRLTAADRIPPEPIDGLLIGGGDDLEPGLYGSETVTTVQIDPERDAFELEMLQQANTDGIPVLGICRGAQLLNVSRGGNLFEDISTMLKRGKPMRTPLPRKHINIEPNSRLATIFGTESCRVNSLHHQAIDRLGENMKVVARDTDGIIQAVEVDEPRFQIGVQWHPEYLPQKRRHRRLFETFVEAARQHRDQLPGKEAKTV